MLGHIHTLEDIMSDMAVYLTAIVLPMLATVPLTAWLCHYRAKHHKRVAVGTTIACGSAFPILLYLFILSVSWGHTKTWHPFIDLGLCCFIASLCILPALGVVAYYQKRAQNNEDHVA
jgi:hypothetical protein